MRVLLNLVKFIITSIIAFTIFGCTTNCCCRQMVVSADPPPHNCRYLGRVTSCYDNFFAQPWLSDKNNEVKAMTALKSQAEHMGANYIQMQNVHHSDPDQSNLDIYCGKAFCCS